MVRKVEPIDSITTARLVKSDAIDFQRREGRCESAHARPGQDHRSILWDVLPQTPDALVDAAHVTAGVDIAIVGAHAVEAERLRNARKRADFCRIRPAFQAVRENQERFHRLDSSGADAGARIIAAPRWQAPARVPH